MGMINFDKVVGQFEECVLCYNDELRIRLPHLAIIVAISNHIKKQHTKCTMQTVDDRSAFVTLCHDDNIKKVYAYLDFSDEQAKVCYKYINNEDVAVPAEEPIPFTYFDEHDVKILEQLMDEKFVGNTIALQHLWALIENKPEDKLLSSLIGDKLLELYQHKPGFTNRIINGSQTTLYSIYFNILTVIKHYQLNLHKPKENVTQIKNKHLKKKGNVITVHQNFNYGSDYITYGFKKDPDAIYAINYWDDGTLQILVNTTHHPAHVDLDHVYSVVIETERKKFEKKIIPLSTIKWVLQDSTHPLLRLSFDDILNLNSHRFYGTRNSTNNVLINKDEYLSDYKDLSAQQWGNLDNIGLSLMELIELTNVKTDTKLDILGLMFYGKEHRPDRKHKLFTIDKSLKAATTLRGKFTKHLNAL